MLTGSVGSVGGVNLHVTNKFVPEHPNPPPPPDYWNELLFPPEFPLAFHELSYLLPHSPQGRTRPPRRDFTRVTTRCGPTPTGSRGWRSSRIPDKIGLHGSIANVERDRVHADYILPMGLGTEGTTP